MVHILKILKVEFESPKLRLMKLAKCLLHIEADVSLHLDQYIISPSIGCGDCEPYPQFSI